MSDVKLAFWCRPKLAILAAPRHCQVAFRGHATHFLLEMSRSGIRCRARRAVTPLFLQVRKDKGEPRWPGPGRPASRASEISGTLGRAAAFDVLLALPVGSSKDPLKSR